MRRLVIVRPEPGASATAQAAARMGLDPIIAPLFEIRPLLWRAPDARGYDGLLLTSANAVRHAGAEIEKLKGLMAHCVGQATAEAARQAGFSIGSIGHGGVDALLGTLPPGLKLLHLCGADRKEPQTPLQSIEPLRVYESVESPKAVGDLCGSVVLLHSPRAAAAFARRIGPDRNTITIVAISSETAGAAGEGWERVETANEPTDAALLAIGFRLCNNRP